MYVQVVTYGLGGISEREYLDVANDVASRFAAMPGLQAKIWLEDQDRGRYGAVYLWDDRESMERFLASDLFEATNRDFVDVYSAGFDVLENLTGQTQPVLDLVPAARQLPRRASGRPAVKKAPATAGATRATGARKIPVTTKSPAKAVAPAKKTTGASKKAAKAAPKKAVKAAKKAGKRSSR
ncbi:MAG TPA: YdhR family protein [Acidimicrobiales bacterium]|nr:YdhR family protein [Acidimicrobiales bacterium]